MFLGADLGSVLGFPVLSRLRLLYVGKVNWFEISGAKEIVRCIGKWESEGSRQL